MHAGGHWKLVERHLIGQPGANTTCADLHQELGILAQGLSNGTFRLYQVHAHVHCEQSECEHALTAAHNALYVAAHRVLTAHAAMCTAEPCAEQQRGAVRRCRTLQCCTR